MNKQLWSAYVMAAAMAAANSAQAAMTFKAMLTNDQEVSSPPIPNEGSSGIGTFVLNDSQTQLSYDVTLTGLDIDGLQTPGNANDNVTRSPFPPCAHRRQRRHCLRNHRRYRRVAKRQ